jgi:hypothetical protein
MVIARRRLALALWIAWAIIVWNVVFDRVLVVAGRAYVHAAAIAASGGSSFARIDDWMRPALPRAFWMATAAGAAILVIGIVAISLARPTPPDLSATGAPCGQPPTR